MPKYAPKFIPGKYYIGTSNNVDYPGIISGPYDMSTGKMNNHSCWKGTPDGYLELIHRIEWGL